MLPRVAPALLVLLLVAPGAGAFPTAREELYLAFDADDPPALLASGATSVQGSVSHGLLVAGSTTTRLEDVPHLIVVDRAAGGIEREVRDATVEVHDGGLFWGFPEGATLRLRIAAPYGLGLGLPQAPVPATNGDPGAGFLLAGASVEGDAGWSGGEADLLPFDATITIRDGTGTPLEGWNMRSVNRGMGSRSDPDALPVVLRAEGVFEARIGASLVGGASNSGAGLTLQVAPAAEDRLAETLAILEETTSSFFGDENPFSQVGGPLDTLAQVSGILNGALLVVPGGVGDAPAIAPLEARYGEAPFDLGALSILRGDMAVAWQEGEMQVSGEPTVALGRNGFEVDEPVTVWIFPVVSLVLWAGALGAIVWYSVKRPPQGAPSLSLRLLSLAFNVLMLLAVFFVWDRSFEATFGTGVVSTLQAQGLTASSLPTLGTLLALELIPWSIAALLFALPVRIALGVALRYLGKGKSFKGLATAGGFLALGILGPIYALWCFNLVWARAAAAMGG